MCELAKRGRSAAVICSAPFVQLAKAQARVFGAPDLPLMVIPHPLGGISQEEIHGRAHHAVPQLMELIKVLRG
jgi:hypothetical protein